MNKRVMMNRETWLNDMARMMAPRFAELGFPLPKFRVAVGWTGAGAKNTIAGECWHSSASADGAFEILIAPILADSIRVAGTLAHELTHAAVGFDQKHGGNFRKVALALGLKGPMTATTEGESFKEWVAPFVNELGAIPHAQVSIRGTLPRPPLAPKPGETPDIDVPELSRPTSTAKPKQTARLLKAICQAENSDGEACGYTVRITRKWVEELGAPCCPVHGQMMMEKGNE